MDLKQHLIRQMAWSHATFGPGQRTDGVLDHIGKELAEVKDGNGDPEEWVDVVILALDGLTRQLAFSLGDGSRRDPSTTAQMAINLIVAKQTKNEGRVWPDWRTADPSKAIEHDRNAA